MSSRSEIVKKNFFASTFIRITGVTIHYFLLPLTVDYLTEIEYGIWATLLTLLTWINMLDFGLGPGLRNMMTESISNGDYRKARSYYSTGLMALSALAILIFLLLYALMQFIDFGKFFNTLALDSATLYKCSLIVLILVTISFILSSADQVYYSYQMAAMPGIVSLTQNLSLLIIIWVLIEREVHGLEYFIIAYGASLLSSRLLFITWFLNKNREMIPSYKYIDFKCFRKLSSTSVRFFVLHITCIFLFSSSNFLISQRLGPEYVRSYDVIFRIFNFMILASSFLFVPLWGAYTDAYIKKDFKWIRQMLKKTLFYILPFAMVAVLLAYSTEWILCILLHEKLDIPDGLPWALGGYVVAHYWLSIWNYFINGIGRVEIEIFASFVCSVISVMIAWNLMPVYGVVGMALAMLISVALFGTIMCIQVQWILHSWK